MTTPTEHWAQLSGPDLIEALRGFGDAYPEDIFPPWPRGTSRDAIAGTAMRRIAVPPLLRAAEVIEAQADRISSTVAAIKELYAENQALTDELNRLRGEGPYRVEGEPVELDPSLKWEYLGP